MKLHILCEKCGCDNYKSLTSPIQFKYHSTYHIPIFECAECGQKYAVAATLKAFIFNQCVCLVPSLLFSIWFMNKAVLYWGRGRGYLYDYADGHILYFFVNALQRLDKLC